MSKPVIMKMRLYIVGLILLLPLSYAQASNSLLEEMKALAAQAEKQTKPVAVGRLLSCEGVSFRDFSPFELEFFDLRQAGHEAHFDILVNDLKHSVLMRARYTYREKSGPLWRAERTVWLSNVSFQRENLSEFFLKKERRAAHLKALFDKEAEAYVLFPKSVLHAGASRDLVEYLVFPLGSAPVVKGPIPVVVKLAEASADATRGLSGEIPWLKIYRAECVSREIDEEENENTLDAWWSLPKVSHGEVLARENLFPNVHGLLAQVPINSTQKDLLAGPALGIGVAATTATIGTQLARMVLARLARNPVAATYFVPVDQPSQVVLDVNALSLSVGQARAFLAASPAEQRGLCEASSGYRSLCDALRALDFEIAYGEGRAL